MDDRKYQSNSAPNYQEYEGTFESSIPGETDISYVAKERVAEK